MANQSIPPCRRFVGWAESGVTNTARTDSPTVLAKDQSPSPSSPFDGLGGIGGKDTSRSDSLATTA
jgi:hypothetical protein